MNILEISRIFFVVNCFMSHFQQAKLCSKFRRKPLQTNHFSCRAVFEENKGSSLSQQSVDLVDSVLGSIRKDGIPIVDFWTGEEFLQVACAVDSLQFVSGA